MSVLAPALNMEENMGLSTPNFFNSAWDPEQSDYSFTEGYQSNMGNHANYAPQFQQWQAENNQLDYFSNTQEVHFSDRSSSPSKYGSKPAQSHDDLDRILASSDSPPLDRGIILKQEPLFPLGHSPRVTSYAPPTVFGVSELEGPLMSSWNLREKTSSPARLKTEIVNDTDRRTSTRYGQITPVDSPPEDARQAVQKDRRTSGSKNKRDESAAPSSAPRAKKARKSKKKPLSKEQEEAKRKKFLERNRVAADKCRQNRKKWIDDLQTKAHYISADNAAKKVSLEELEQEVLQLKSLLFIHSRTCNEKDVLAWVEKEANKVQLELKQPRENPLVGFIQSFGEPSSPASSRGYGSVSEAVSRRYSLATAGDDTISSADGAPSEQNSRRTSFAQ